MARILRSVDIVLLGIGRYPWAYLVVVLVMKIYVVPGYHRSHGIPAVQKIQDCCLRRRDI
jgi:hypothetical protein